MALLEVDGLAISFADKRVVEGVSFAVRAGERFGIVGESGSGKTLTGLSIAGLLPIGARMLGKIRLDGQELPRNERALARLRGRKIGFVFQEPMSALNPLMRIGAQIGEAVVLAGTGHAVGSLLAAVGLEPDHADRFPHQLSGGQRQRVMIAIALACDPDLLIADEPTSALDLVTQRTVLDLIARLCAERHMALIFISHDLKAVSLLCQTVAVMRAGRLVERGSAEQVLERPRHDYTSRLIEASRLRLRGVARAPIGDRLLEVRGVSRHYRQGGLFGFGGSQLAAVREVSFAVNRAECVALVGPSGCGKTTLARMLVGLDGVSGGHIVFDGERHHGNDLPRHLRADLSLVFQDPFSSFDPRLTIGQSLGEPLRLQPRLAANERQARLLEAITAVGLSGDMLTRYPHAFSGGQRQRLAIARALVTRPRFVVLDEPVSALDVSVRAEVLALLMRLQGDFGLTYLVISHDLDMVRAIADRVLVMEAGRIVETGRPADLFANPRHEMTRALVEARLPQL